MENWQTLYRYRHSVLYGQMRNIKRMIFLPGMLACYFTGYTMELPTLRLKRAMQIYENTVNEIL